MTTRQYELVLPITWVDLVWSVPAERLVPCRGHGEHLLPFDASGVAVWRGPLSDGPWRHNRTLTLYNPREIRDFLKGDHPMTVNAEHAAELARAIARATNDELLFLADASVLATRELPLHPGARAVYAALAAVVGIEQRDRERTARQARRDQANARVPEAGWGESSLRGDHRP